MSHLPLAHASAHEHVVEAELEPVIEETNFVKELKSTRARHLGQHPRVRRRTMRETIIASAHAAGVALRVHEAAEAAHGSRDGVRSEPEKAAAGARMMVRALRWASWTR